MPTFLMTATIVVLTCALGSFAQARDVTVSGCARSVEKGCIVITDKGGTYNISGAKPTPLVDSYGTVTGTILNSISHCMLGVILKPATWVPDPKKFCPLGKKR
jgi:hypothetical protein